MKKEKLILCLLTSVLCSTALFVACSNNDDALESQKYEINFTPAKTSAELEAIRADKSTNVLRTLSDFDKVVSLKQSPLSKLSDNIISEFRNEIVVREVGIVGLKFGIAKDHLSDNDFAEVMAMFGLDTKEGFWGFSDKPEVTEKMAIRGGRVATDYEGYRCTGRANCDAATDFICMSGC